MDSPERLSEEPGAGGSIEMSRSRMTGLITGGAIGNAVTITPAVHSVFGTFLIPITKEFHWYRAEYSFVLTIVALAAAVGYPLVGRLADNWGTKRFLIVGYVMFAAALAALTLLNGSVLQLYMFYALVGISGSIPSTSLLSKIIAEHFESRRGMALGLTAGLGNSVGCVILPIVAAIMLQSYGWRAAYMAISVIVLILGVSTALFLLPESKIGPVEQRSSRPNGLAAVFTLSFWILLIAVGFGAGALAVIFSHIVPILAERGFDLALATAAITVCTITSVIFQVGLGRLLDHIPSPVAILPFYLAIIPGLALFEYGHGVLSTMAGAACVGMASGAAFAALPFFIARYFDIRHFGLLIGLMYSALVVAQGVVPVALDASFDISRSYRGALLVGSLCYLIGALALIVLPKVVRGSRSIVHR
jgi:MFS family permease